MGRSDVTISPSTFPKREITKECPHKNEIMDIVMDIVEDLVEEKDFKVVRVLVLKLLPTKLASLPKYLILLAYKISAT